MNRCGYCKKNNWRNNWVLVPVTIVTRGKRIKSWCHKTCIPKWRKITDVTVRDDSENTLEQDAAKDARTWLDVILPQQARERDRRRNERNRINNQRCCIDCGKLIYWRQSTRCPSCHSKYQHQAFRKPEQDKS